MKIKRCFLKRHKHIYMGIFALAVVTSVVSVVFTNYFASASVRASIFESANNLTPEQLASQDVTYLSEITPVSAQVGWGNLGINQASDGSKIKLLVGSDTITFDKGIFAHATSTLVYNLSAYTDKYDYFTTYYGLNTSAGGKGNGVKFSISTSADCSTYELRNDNSIALRSTDSAVYVKIPLENVKCLKLHAHDNGANGQDHSVWADAKLIKSDYVENVTKPLADYDSELHALVAEGKENTNEFELKLLQRTLVSKIGNYNLKQLYSNDDAREALIWLTSDLRRLRLFIGGGDPDGSWVNAITVLGRLYRAYKSDLTETRTTTDIYGLDKTAYQTPLKDIYEKMMFSLALTHSKTISSWMKYTGSASANTNISDPLARYAVYKDLLLNKYLEIKIFERLEIEEMRFVFNNQSSDDEIKWLNNYTMSKNWYNSYSVMAYSRNGYYSSAWRNDKYYGNGRKNYESKYKLTGYDIANVAYYPKLWMAMETGSVCWGVSYMGDSMVTSHGVPATPMHQYKNTKSVAHIAYLTYRMDGSGNGTWDLNNDAFGWQYSSWKDAGAIETTTLRGTNPRRPIAGWDNSNIASYDNGSYVDLGQSVINDYDNYIKAEEKIMLANTYPATDYENRERLYREALAIQSINWDALKGLVTVYKATASTRSQDDILNNLVKVITQNLTYYPLPMENLYNQVKGLITDGEAQASMAMARTSALDKAVARPWSICHIMAKFIRGDKPVEPVAKFSFDNNIIDFQLNDRYSTSFIWEYSLDGGTTWHEVIESNVAGVEANSKWALTTEEAESITPANGIIVNIKGITVDRNPDDFYHITIGKQDNLNKNLLYVNPYEQSVQGIGAAVNIEWRFEGETLWATHKLIDTTIPRNIEIRKRATGTLVASDIVTLSIPPAVNRENERYISPFTYLSPKNMPLTYEVTDASSNSSTAYGTIMTANASYQSGIYTASASNGYITVKFYKPMYVSRVQTVFPTGSIQYVSGGMVKDGRLEYSDDNGATWHSVNTTVVADTTTGLADFYPDESFYATHVRIVVTSATKSTWSIGLINFFQDMTKVTPGIDVEYSTTTATNEDVTVTIKPQAGFTVSETSLTFTENGTKTITYTDDSGAESTLDIDVNWIDKTPPVVSLVYSTSSPTNGNVNVSIVVNERHTVVSGGSAYTFTENGTHDFVVKDFAGNVVTKTATVSTIDKTAPTVTSVSYSPAKPADGSTVTDRVTAELTFNEPITFTDTDGLEISPKNSAEENPLVYIVAFNENRTANISYCDRVRNTGSVELSVDWMEAGPAIVNLEYSELETTHDNVIAKITSNEAITVLNNNGSKEYTFYDNGEFTFEYVDGRGNHGEITAVVNWIEKETPYYVLNFSRTTLDVDPVDVTLEFSQEADVELLNGTAEVTRVVDGPRISYVYTFTENGTYVFHYKYTYNTNDILSATRAITLGNSSDPGLGIQQGDITVEGIIPVTVTWIGEPTPTPTPNPDPNPSPTPTPTPDPNPTPTPTPDPSTPAPITPTEPAEPSTPEADAPQTGAFEAESANASANIALFACIAFGIVVSGFITFRLKNHIRTRKA